jgi:hypothetical protein
MEKPAKPAFVTPCRHFFAFAAVFRTHATVSHRGIGGGGGEGEIVGEAVGETVGDAEAVDVAVGVDVPPGHDTGVAVEVGLLVGVAVDVGDFVGHDPPCEKNATTNIAASMWIAHELFVPHVVGASPPHPRKVLPAGAPCSVNVTSVPAGESCLHFPLSFCAGEDEQKMSAAGSGIGWPPLSTSPYPLTSTVSVHVRAGVADGLGVAVAVLDTCVHGPADLGPADGESCAGALIATATVTPATSASSRIDVMSLLID